MPIAILQEPEDISNNDILEVNKNMEFKKQLIYPGYEYQPLFNLMASHGLTLLQSEMDDIINTVRSMDSTFNTPENCNREFISSDHILDPIDYLNIPYGPLMEEWRYISGWEGFYKISNYGVVRSLDKDVKYINMYGYKNAIKIIPKSGRIKKACACRRTGYYRLVLMNNNLKKTVAVHRLLCETFIPNIGNKPQVNHKNMIRDDFFVSNLEWVTSKENMQHAMKNNPSYVLNRSQNRLKLSDKEVAEIVELLKTATPQRDIAKQYKVSKSTISSINCGTSLYKKRLDLCAAINNTSDLINAKYNY